MLCNLFDKRFCRFIPTTAFCFLPSTDFPRLPVVDARHGRVLGQRGSMLVVWDPITDKMRELPFPQKSDTWTAAVLCSAAAGACNHLDCHNGPFRVVFVCVNIGSALVYTYSSNAAAWSEPVGPQQNYHVDPFMGSALVGNALYFGNLVRSTALKYDLELCQLSLICLPSLWRRSQLQESLLTTMEDGGLGLVRRDDSKLYMWSRKDTHEVHATWERSVIELKTVFPVDIDVTKLILIGSGVDIIFMRTGNEVYTIDLRTYKVKKVYEGIILTILPYMSFYTAVFRVATTGLYSKRKCVTMQTLIGQQDFREMKDSGTYVQDSILRPGVGI
ncbi:unnamed protein product [Miscanthus lutarioriparius]|uniref:F-box protein AT5G49610-like beta-propeller domain-containing protein n=1 Tax=Miscanthus lutarioriparius TaxID=422564 RepID=A0A811ND81_9POAL|nr:unnamed protein product [Miscanthus lutarioriparius]